MVDYFVYAENEKRSKLFHNIGDVRSYCINKAVHGNVSTEAYKVIKTKNGSYDKLVLKCKPVKNGSHISTKMVEY